MTKRSKRFLILGIILVFLLAGWIFLRLVYLAYQEKNANLPNQFGVSFSDKYARELGLDPRETYTKLLNDLGVRKFRLMSYWNEIEPTKNQYDFSNLDWQIQQANLVGAKVSLAIGLRQPRYPECHYPAWTNNLDYQEQLQALYAYLTAVVERYKGNSAISSWQLENEGLNHGFGTCRDFSRSRISAEYDLVKRLDSAHPIIMNVSDEVGLPVRGPRGDEVGLSVYKRFHESKFCNCYLSYPMPAWWHGLRAALIDYFWHKPVIIHELQAEPWGPAATVQLSSEEQTKTMDATKLQAIVNYARRTNIRETYLWGGEWWYWRKIKFNDDSAWQVAKQIFTADH